MNQLTGSVKSMWYGLDMKRYYLLEFNSPAVTAAYLWNVLNHKCFHNLKKDVKQGTLLKHATKIILLDEISKIAKALAINEKNMPDKIWLANVLLTPDKNNNLFRKPSEDFSMQVTQEQIKLLKDLDTSLFRGKGKSKFFKRTALQIDVQKYESLNQRISKQKARVARKQQEKTQAYLSLLRAEGKQESLKRTIENMGKEKKL